MIKKIHSTIFAFLSLSFLMLVYAPSAYASIANYSVTTSTAGAGSNQSSTSYTVPSGPNRLLVVLISTEDTVDADRVVSSVSWNTSETLTVARDQQNDTDNVGAHIYYLVNPTATTANVVVNFAGNVTSIGVTAMTLFNAQQTSVLDNNEGSNQSDTTSPNDDITTGTDYAFVVSVVTNNVNVGLTSTQTEKSDYSITGARQITSVTQKDAAGTQNMGYTAGGTTDDFAQAVASFKTISTSIHVNGVITTSTNGAGTNTSTTSHTVPSTGANRVLVVTISTEDTSDTDRLISSVTWNTSESFTAAHDQQNDTDNVGANIYYLVNPTVTTADVVVTFGGTVSFLGVTILSLSNVDQTTPKDANNGANFTDSTSPTVDVTTNTALTFLISVNTNNATTALTSARGEIADITTSGGRHVVQVAPGETSAGTETMGYSGGGATNDHAIAAAAFRQASANTAPSAPTTLYTNERATTAQSGVANPVAVGDATPVFSSIYNDSDSGDIANKYEIIVYSDSGCTSQVWDSGSGGTAIANCTQGNRCADVTFSGTALVFDGTQYYWKMKYWDDDGTAGSFSNCSDNFTMISVANQLHHGLYFFNNTTERVFTW